MSTIKSQEQKYIPCPLRLQKYSMTKNDTNSDIGLEIPNGLGTAYVPATTKDEARRRLHIFIIQ